MSMRSRIASCMRPTVSVNRYCWKMRCLRRLKRSPISHRCITRSIWKASTPQKKYDPDVPQVAVFDTSFHQTMPPTSYLYPIPYEYYEKYRIRKYEFHGSSHRYVSERAARTIGLPLESLRLISCHIGNGVSLTASQR